MVGVLPGRRQVAGVPPRLPGEKLVVGVVVMAVGVVEVVVVAVAVVLVAVGVVVVLVVVGLEVGRGKEVTSSHTELTAAAVVVATGKQRYLRLR